MIIASELSQNMDGKYKGYLGAQALAGSVTGTADAAMEHEGLPVPQLIDRLIALAVERTEKQHG